MKCRTLIDSLAANCPSVIGSWSLRSAHARAAEVPGADRSGTGRRMYWTCPPSRWGGTTVRRATSLATAVPWSRRIMCRHRSIPEAQPAEVSTVSPSVYRTSGSSSTRGKSRANRSVYRQWVVAACPSSSPAEARTKAPVQIEATRVPGRIRAKASASGGGSAGVSST